jgi:hypothetical protein
VPPIQLADSAANPFQASGEIYLPTSKYIIVKAIIILKVAPKNAISNFLPNFTTSLISHLISIRYNMSGKIKFCRLDLVSLISIDVISHTPNIDNITIVKYIITIAGKYSNILDFDFVDTYTMTLHIIIKDVI